jgi:Flp pilus assembly protein TadG
MNTPHWTQTLRQRQLWHQFQRRTTGDSGQASVFVLILLLCLLAFGGLVYDGGTALTAKTHALDIAESAARAGCQQLDLTALREHGTTAALLNPGRAHAAAVGYLDRARATGTVTATTTQVTVTITSTVRTRLLGAVGIRTLTVHATGVAHPQQQPQP